MNYPHDEEVGWWVFFAYIFAILLGVPAGIFLLAFTFPSPIPS